jgi:hypothetical protein
MLVGGRGGKGASGGVPSAGRPGRNDEEDDEDLSSEPGRLREPDGLRVLSSYGIRLPEELSGGVLPS